MGLTMSGSVDGSRMPAEAEWLTCGTLQLWLRVYSIWVSLSLVSAQRVLKSILYRKSQEKCPGTISARAMEASR